MHILQIGPKSPKWTLSIQVGRNPTWGQLRPARPQLRPNLAPRWRNFGQLKSIWLQDGGHSRPNPKSSKRPFSLVFSTFFAIDDANVPHIVSPSGAWCDAVAKGELRHLRTDLDFHVHHMASIWRPYPTWPIFARLCSYWAQDSATGPSLSWAQLRRQMPPQDQVTRAKPNLRPNVPKLRHVGPQLGSSWAQVRANWPEFGASYAQVGPKWATVRPTLRPRSKFDPSRALGWGKWGPLLSSPSYSPGAGGSRRKVTRIGIGIGIYIYIYIYYILYIIYLYIIYYILLYYIILMLYYIILYYIL